MTTQAHPLLPFRSHFITIAGFRMHYIDEGEGPVVMLLHGNPTWCFYYRNLIKRLKKNFRVIAPDFLGLGLSDHPADAHFRASHRITHLEELVDKLQLKSFSLVMHDWGGSIGTGLAVRYPEKIEKLVYLNTTLTETEALPALIKTAAAPVIGKFLTQYTKQFLRFTTKLGVAKKLPKDVRNGYYFPYKTSSRRIAIWDFVDDIPFDSAHPSYAEMLDLAEKLPRLKNHPVKIIWGLRDPCFHREMLTKVAKHFPQAEIVEIPDASHLVLEDAPELAETNIEEFLLGEHKPASVTQCLSHDGASGGEGEVNALYEAFLQVSKSSPNKPAAIEPLFLGDAVRYGHSSYREVTERIHKYERGLVELGLRAGDRVLMLVPAGVEFLALSYAVMGRGALPIFIDPGIGREKLFQCIRDVKPDVLIGSPKAQLLRFKRNELFPHLRFHITASDWLFTGGPKLSFLKRFSPQPLPPAHGSGGAFVAFTSGATGIPKGVMFTNEMIREQLRIFRDVFELEPGKKDLPLLPIFSLFHLALGVCSVFPAIDSARPLNLSPERIVRIITDLQIDYSFGSPTLWKKISEYCVRSGEVLSSMKKILMAGAPVPKDVLERVKEVMESGVVYTPYGATEALPVTLVSSESILNQHDVPAKGGEQGTFVGHAVDGVSVRVVKSFEAVPDSPRELVDCSPFEIGEVLVSGKNVSPLYFERPQETASAKVQDGERFWHRMGDMGYLDEEENLYFCGRKAHRVQGNSRLYYSVPTERIFNDHPKVKRSALVSLQGEAEPGIVLEPFPQHWPDTDEKRRTFLKEIENIAAQHELTKNIRWFFFHPSFPVDARHNAKIYRDQLSTWAAQYITVEDAA